MLPSSQIYHSVIPTVPKSTVPLNNYGGKQEYTNGFCEAINGEYCDDHLTAWRSQLVFSNSHFPHVRPQTRSLPEPLLSFYVALQKPSVYSRLRLADDRVIFCD